MKDVFTLSTPVSFPAFEEKVRTAIADLPRLEAQVAQYMLLNIGDLSFETGVSIASKVGVSEVTVSRLLRRLGYRGMRGLKKELHDELFIRESPHEDEQQPQGMSHEMTRNIELEHKALNEIYQQCASPMWSQLVQSVTVADEVHVTGFQAVRGMAEDCARRLSMSRSRVRFLSAHDNMLSEWLMDDDVGFDEGSRCLILIDVVPYAREAKVLAEICSGEGHSLIVFTDEMCHWAKRFTDMVIFARTRTGLTMESTVAIGAALNLLVNSIADQYAKTLPDRVNRWKGYTRTLKLF